MIADSKVLESHSREIASTIKSDRPITTTRLKSSISDQHSKLLYRTVRSRAISQTCPVVHLKCTKQWFIMQPESRFQSTRLVYQANAHLSPSKSRVRQIRYRLAQYMVGVKLKSKMNFYCCRERGGVGDLCPKSQRKVRFDRALVASRRQMRRQKEPNLVQETIKSQRCAYLTLISRSNSAKLALVADPRSFQSSK